MREEVTYRDTSYLKMTTMFVVENFILHNIELKRIFVRAIFRVASFFKSIFYPVPGLLATSLHERSPQNCPNFTFATINFFATGPPSPLKWPSKLERNYAFNGPFLRNGKS